MKNKKIYKAIACVSVWLSVIIAIFGVATFSSKVKAGVIIDSGYTQTTGPLYVSDDGVKYFAMSYMTATSGTSGINIGTIGQPSPYLTGSIRFGGLDLLTAGTVRVRLQCFSNQFTSTAYKYYQAELWTNSNNETFVIFSITELLQEVIQTNNLNATTTYAQLNYTGAYYFQRQNIISSVNNIYDLQQGDVAIIYISDVSGFDSENYQPEITINWGYIDSSDNTVYAAYSPTVNVMKATGDLEIWLNIPTDAGGTVYDSVILNQQVLLSLITDGASSANANIYALYVWLLSDRIQWGLLNFNTAGLPASAQSMNYFTSYTTKYDYINNNTGSMTCRLSISNNFNFITIKNQPVLSVNTINTTLRQGGLLPAWSLYNWARGTATGFTSGTQAGAAPYQPGNTGYNEIYQAGYDAGLTAQPAAAWYEAAFAAVDTFLNIHIFPSITFGELFGIPFVISVVYFIIRAFRGGGSNG